jgi:cation-transporting ATPase E
VQQTQASTGALITLLIGVCGCWPWWPVPISGGASHSSPLSALAYVAIFALPLAREKFMLDPSNVKLTAGSALIGLAAAALIEASWWIQGRVLREPRLLWRTAD